MQRKQNKTKINTSSKYSKIRIGIVVSQYNIDITGPMRDAAILTLRQAGVAHRNITLSEAPGSFEIPFVCQRLARSKKFDGLIAIGCVIRGDTDHYHFISNEATRGVMDVMLKHHIPIANAILTVNNLEQASIRSNGDQNKGVEAASALLSLLA